VGWQFSASLIEVPTEEVNGPLSEQLWREGVRYFHIDVGDGKFISRRFSGLEKARYLRQKFPQACLHVHLMTSDPHQSRDGEPSVIQQYRDAGANAIAVHARAISDRGGVADVLRLIRKLGCRPGLIIETSDTIDQRLRQLIEEVDLDWAVVMGVPVGYGGQIFQYTTISRIASMHELVAQRGKPFLIEVDGGLNLDNLRLCRNAGAQIFAGWSIIKGSDPAAISRKLSEVRAVLSEEEVRAITSARKKAA
jgi:ribulose-phosphate 3-epimerase